MIELTRLERKFSGKVDTTVTLGFADRHRRRILLALDDGTEALLNLKTAERFEEGDALIGERAVAVKAAIEDVLVISGKNLTELAWHIGNRHLPAQMTGEEIIIAYDHVIAHMLIGLGAQVQREGRAFSPIAGAYHSHAHDH